MRRIAIALAFAAAGSVAAAPGSAQAAKNRCSTEGKTYAQNAYVRVYSRDRSGDPVYACAFKKGRRVRVGNAGECFDASRVTDVVLAGNFAAVVTLSCGLVSGDEAVGVYNVRTRRRVHRGSAVTPSSSGGEFSTEINGVVLKRSGAVAWIGSADVDGDQRREVRKIESGNSVVILDSGADIVKNSIALAGSTIYWTKGGIARSASLAG